MRFSLQDVKRQVSRRAGELAVTLHFLRAGELRAEIARLLAYHEQRLGQKHRDFAQDEARALVGDYRLANCLLAVLSAWYTWQSPAWDAVLNELSEETRMALDEAALRSPIALRLVLFDYVNTRHSGFLDARERPEALAKFAALYHLDVTRLEYLLALDTEDETVLARLSAEPPEAESVAALYNQWVFEAALFNASEVHFVIDCAAFLRVQQAETTGALTGLGAVIKRLCFLARKLGVYYDLAYEETPSAAPATLLHLTLYGPQEMTGSPQQYGQRLARLCRMLLDYGAASGNRRQSSAALGKAIRQAEATVYIFQQAYHFSMNAELLALLPAPEQTAGRVAESAAVYDSSIEQSFAEAFASLERGQGVSGWQLEREPEPLLLPGDTGGIFIPDFALTRGTRRIYIEILGFWTPAYRERKMQKLRQLRGRADLVLAVPIEASQFFAGLATDYPLVEYRNQLSATDLLRVMQAHYDDFTERLAALDVERAREHTRAARLVPERDCYELLGCYRRAELAQAAARVIVPGEIAYTPGIGLYLTHWLEHLHRSFVEWVEAKNCFELSLSVIIQECKSSWPELTGCDDATIEALLALWPEVEIQRASIFEATLNVVALRGSVTETGMDAPEAAPRSTSPARKGVRERRASSKKPVRQETSQQNLWE